MPSFAPDREVRAELLSRLRAALSEHWGRGERLSVEQYLQQHPELASDPEAVAELVHAEVLLRHESGETPTLDEYLARFPQYAERIRRRWDAHRRLAGEWHPDPQGTTGSDRVTGSAAPGGPPPGLPSLPGYEVQEVLGKGGMGVVFKAVQLAFGRTVAVKMIRSQVLAGAEELARFRTEAQAVGRLDHPHVVRVFAFGQEQDCPFLVMEYLAGSSLARLLHAGPLDVRRAAELVGQVAQGVQAAHEAGILHRDLKPANVLLDAAGQARVADFGLAKLLDADSAQTLSAAVMGTPAYMAPEQAAGRAREVGRATDVWALGVVLYECLTGKVPFQGSSRQETLRLIQTAAPAPPRQVRPEVPPQLQAVCLKCLEKEPPQRYESAGALAEDLRAWLEGQTPSAHAGRSVLGWLRRRPRTVLVGLAVAGALLLALAPWGLSPPPDGSPSRAGTRALIDTQGMPARHHFRLGGEQARLTRSPDGHSQLHSTGPCYFDLARQVRWDRFRIHVQIRHETLHTFGAVGLYFGASEHPTPAGVVHRCFRISFNDLVDENNHVPPVMRGKVPLQKGNRLKGTLVHTGSLAGHPTWVVTASPFFSPDLFKPSGNPNRLGDWRTLVVEVAPPEIRVWWDEKTLVARIGVARLQEEVRTALRGGLRSRDRTIFQALRPGFDLRGAVGLYLFRGSASFRLARIEPLANDGAAN